MGKWIWVDGSDVLANSYVHARKLFELASKPASAILKTSAHSKYKLYVNGEYVGKGPVRGGPGYTYYDTHDITPLLNKGKNVIAFLVHYIGEDTNAIPARSPGLICKTEIEVGDEQILVLSDETWKVRRAADWTNTGARLGSGLGFQEVYDAAEMIEDWNQVKFREKGWQDAAIVGSVPSPPWGRLVAREIPPLNEQKIFPHAITGLFNSPERGIDTPPGDVAGIMAESELSSLTTGNVKSAEALLSEHGATHIKTPRGDAGVVMILDFGREVFGNVEIGIGGSGSGIIDIGYGELLEDGRVKPNRGGLKYTDRLILKKGKLHWQSFESRAFRYMQIEFRRCSKAVALDHVMVNQTTYPVKYTGSFECDDGLLNEIWKVGAYTTELCMEDTFIDCPWRERAQWWGDARIESRAAYYAFDDTKLLAQGLRQMADLQDRDGAMPGMYPGGSDKLVPDFALQWVFSLLDYYAFADDAGLLRDLYPNVRGMLNWFGGFMNEDGLLSGVPGWLFIDWADLDKRGDVTALNCLYFQALRVAGLIAAVLGKENEAEQYTESANTVRLAINKHLYAPKRGLYAECRVDGKLVERFSRQTNILAALFDIPDHYQKSTIIRHLLNGSLPELSTPYFTSHMLEVLYAGEFHEDALRVIRRKWGDMIRAGATTFWEFFNQDGSLCHGWSAGPVRGLIAEYVGIKPVLGSHRFSITPHTGDLKWAKGSINTRTGPLTAEWHIVRNVLTITVDVPQGLKVDVYPPCPPDYKISVDGKLHPVRFVTLGSGTHQVKVTAGRPAKPAPEDASLKPMPIQHVEILGEAMTRRRRSIGLTSTRRGTRTGRSSSTIIADIPSDMEMAAEQVAPDLEMEVGAERPAVETTETAKRPRRRRTRRGGHGREGTADVEAVRPPTEPVQAAETVSEAPTPEAEAAPKSRRRRSRRGGRGRSGHSESQTPEIAHEPAPAEHHPTPESHIEPEAVPVHEPADGEQKPRRRRSHRGGRRRSGTGSTSPTDGEAHPVDSGPSQEQPAHAPEPIIETPPQSSDEAPKRRRRTYTRRPRVQPDFTSQPEPPSGEE
ncbi:MAG: family 78 glycoside hydrolase catalytic domain [Armatimonadetes bacterium]|nr:family 78 glycoside hydrolase catalytic domain [Armatimonadota bacterium]